jgi:hypothetical protein
MRLGGERSEHVAHQQQIRQGRHRRCGFGGGRAHRGGDRGCQRLGDGDHHRHDIRLEARGGTATFVNVRHLSHPAVGDEVILAQPLFSAAHPSQLAGHGFVTVILLGRNSEQDHATLVLRQGEIDAAGVQGPGNTFQLAVTGGTGRFQNARGQADVKLLPGPGNKALITLHLLP